MASTKAVVKDLKPNSFVAIDGAPCRVDKVQVSSSGKHGHSKVRLDAKGLLDGRTRSIIEPADEEIEVPIVEKKQGQVLSITGNNAQVMDMTDFQVFDMEIPEERKDEVKQGEEIDYYEVSDIKTLKKLK
jgi:translation initiation factor 5A